MFVYFVIGAVSYKAFAIIWNKYNFISYAVLDYFCSVTTEMKTIKGVGVLCFERLLGLVTQK